MVCHLRCVTLYEPILRWSLVTVLELTTFAHVDSLRINHQSTMKKVVLNRFTYVRSLTVERDSSSSIEYILTYLDVSRITKFHHQLYETCETLTNELVRILHTFPSLRLLTLVVSTLVLFFYHQWPHIVDLRINRYLHMKLILFGVHLLS
jgi:hypothetical protein